jgi:hypothetical protein
MFRHIIHRIIIINFIIGIGYGTYQVYFVLKVKRNGPLFSQTKDMPDDLFMKRRLFARETRIIIA